MHTRHNVGFDAVERVVGDMGASWSAANADDGEISRLSFPGGQEVRVVKPHTFMNASGDMVVPLARYYKIPPESVLVVADDFNLPLGRIRIRLKGSAGGQRGLESILERFGTKDLPRIRMGIGPVPGRFDPADFVLGRFRKDEEEARQEMTARAAEAIRVCCEKGVAVAMNSFNGDPK